MMQPPALKFHHDDDSVAGTDTPPVSSPKKRRLNTHGSHSPQREVELGFPHAEAHQHQQTNVAPAAAAATAGADYLHPHLQSPSHDHPMLQQFTPSPHNRSASPTRRDHPMSGGYFATNVIPPQPTMATLPRSGSGNFKKSTSRDNIAATLAAAVQSMPNPAVFGAHRHGRTDSNGGVASLRFPSPGSGFTPSPPPLHFGGMLPLSRSSSPSFLASGDSSTAGSSAKWTGGASTAGSSKWTTGGVSSPFGMEHGTTDAFDGWDDAAKHSGGKGLSGNHGGFGMHVTNSLVLPPSSGRSPSPGGHSHRSPSPFYERPGLHGKDFMDVDHHAERRTSNHSRSSSTMSHDGHSSVAAAASIIPSNATVITSAVVAHRRAASPIGPLTSSATPASPLTASGRPSRAIRKPAWKQQEEATEDDVHVATSARLRPAQVQQQHYMDESGEQGSDDDQSDDDEDDRSRPHSRHLSSSRPAATAAVAVSSSRTVVQAVLASSVASPYGGSRKLLPGQTPILATQIPVPSGTPVPLAVKVLSVVPPSGLGPPPLSAFPSSAELQASASSSSSSTKKGSSAKNSPRVPHTTLASAISGHPTAALAIGSPGLASFHSKKSAASPAASSPREGAQPLGLSTPSPRTGRRTLAARGKGSPITAQPVRGIASRGGNSLSQSASMNSLTGRTPSSPALGGHSSHSGANSPALIPAIAQRSPLKRPIEASYSGSPMLGPSQGSSSGNTVAAVVSSGVPAVAALMTTPGPPAHSRSSSGSTSLSGGIAMPPVMATSISERTGRSSGGNAAGGKHGDPTLAVVIPSKAHRSSTGGGGHQFAVPAHPSSSSAELRRSHSYESKSLHTSSSVSNTSVPSEWDIDGSGAPIQLDPPSPISPLAASAFDGFPPSSGHAGAFGSMPLNAAAGGAWRDYPSSSSVSDYHHHPSEFSAYRSGEAEVGRLLSSHDDGTISTDHFFNDHDHAGGGGATSTLHSAHSHSDDRSEEQTPRRHPMASDGSIASSRGGHPETPRTHALAAMVESFQWEKRRDQQPNSAGQQQNHLHADLSGMLNSNASSLPAASLSHLHGLGRSLPLHVPDRSSSHHSSAGSAMMLSHSGLGTSSGGSLSQSPPKIRANHLSSSGGSGAGSHSSAMHSMMSTLNKTNSPLFSHTVAKHHEATEGDKSVLDMLDL